MQKLENVLNQIEQNIEFHERVNESVSKVSVGWQLEHTMLVINNVVEALEKSNAKEYRFKYTPIRFFIMAIGKIPRGKGRAPKGVNPLEEEPRTIEGLKTQLEKAKLSIQKLPTLNKDQFFIHPLFGNMKRNSTIKFLGIHSNHHLAIIKDILG